MKKIISEIYDEVINQKQKKPCWKNVRKSCNQSGSNYPVRIVDGDDSPHTIGECCHYETKGGDMIYHPNSYSKIGWSNMVYHPSTIEIVVGINWLKENDPENFRRYAIGSIESI